VLHIDGEAVDFRNRGFGAADREQRGQREKSRKSQERAAVAFHARRQATAALAGTMASRTKASGQCRMLIARNVASAIAGPATARFLKSGRGTVASISPAAAAATPVSMRYRTGTSP